MLQIIIYFFKRVCTHFGTPFQRFKKGRGLLFKNIQQKANKAS